MLNKYFDHVFCINLKRREDRRAQAEAEFKKHGIEVEFIEAIDGKLLDLPKMVSSDSLTMSPGDIGCTLSHLNVVKLAKERGYKKYFVTEDDIEFADDFNEKFEEYFKQLPSDWDIVYGGGSNVGGLVDVTPNISRIIKTYTTHAFGVKESMYDAMIEVWSNPEKVDISLSSLQTKFNCYIFQPHICFQRGSYSDLLERYNEAEHLLKPKNNGSSNI